MIQTGKSELEKCFFLVSCNYILVLTRGCIMSGSVTHNFYLLSALLCQYDPNNFPCISITVLPAIKPGYHENPSGCCPLDSQHQNPALPIYNTYNFCIMPYKNREK